MLVSLFGDTKRKKLTQYTEHHQSQFYIQVIQLGDDSAVGKTSITHKKSLKRRKERKTEGGKHMNEA